jgi:hypothetical protein
MEKNLRRRKILLRLDDSSPDNSSLGYFFARKIRVAENSSPRDSSQEKFFNKRTKIQLNLHLAAL